MELCRRPAATTKRYSSTENSFSIEFLAVSSAGSLQKRPALSFLLSYLFF
jgi:hypothetical protein